jgi:hypothetical protein
VVKQAVGAPGLAAELLRPLLYRLVDLSEPIRVAEFPPHDVPVYQAPKITTFVVGVTDHGEVTGLVRYPSTSIGHDLDDKHLVAHATQATLRQLSGATIVYTVLDTAERFDDWSGTTLRQWPDAQVAAAVVSDRVCLTRTRDGTSHELTSSDPLLAASLVYLGRVSAVERFTAGSRTTTVAIRAR